MPQAHTLDSIAINVKSHRLLKQLLKENPTLEEVMRNARNETEALVGVKNWVMEILQANPSAVKYFEGTDTGHEVFHKLGWKDLAAIRVLDYVDNAGREFDDLNLRGQKAVSNPIKLIWLAVTHGTGGAKPFFFEDMLHLFRQLSGAEKRGVPTSETLREWTERYPSGLDPRIVKLREENRDRIINIIITKIDSGEVTHGRFKFDPEMS